MIDPDALLGVLQALVREVGGATVEDPVPDLLAYRDRIVALAESVGICGDPAPSTRSIVCDLDADHRGLHSGLTWEGPADAIIAPARVHWQVAS